MPLAMSLQRLDFQETQTAMASGLVRVGSGAGSHAFEEAVLREVEATFGTSIDFVYFRRFGDQRAPQPLALVVDNADERLSRAELAKLHEKLWWSGIAPLLYVGWPTRVDVLAARRSPDFWDRDHRAYKPWSHFDIVGDVASALDGIHRLSALRLADGSFWDAPGNAGVISHSKSASGELVRAIKKIDSELGGDSNEHIRRLLLFTILIKYLDDRRVFPDGWFRTFVPDASSFHDVLCAGDPSVLGALFSALRDHFNGDVFAGGAESVVTLTTDQIRALAELVEGRADGAQRLLWSRYSFEHLPVEVVSNVYERFVSGRTAVYTPPFLAAFMLDNVLPWDKIEGTESVLDPACGSGVFLVGAFKRLIVAWRAKHGWRKPDVATLKAILRGSIFGVELDPFAAELTVFSLCLALCDALKPDVIWRDLRFDRLGGDNISTGDYFEVVNHKRFDVVVGNPPFESELSSAASMYEDRAAGERPGLPDQQIAYLFLEHTLRHLTPRGRVCLLQPHGLIYNRKTAAFRDHLLRTYVIDAVLDFVSIRTMFGGADVKTLAIVGRAVAPDASSTTVHRLLRRTTSTAEQVSFELDHYDHHQALQTSISDNWWRANLLGGGRLSTIAARFSQMRSVEDFVTSQPGWQMGEGFIAARGDHPPTFLTGRRFLPTTALSQKGINYSKVSVVTETSIRWPRTEVLFTAPLVVVKEHESLPMDFVSDGFLAFRDKIVGISAPKKDHDRLKEVYDRLLRRRRQYRFLCALQGRQALLGKATAILKSDIVGLPFPESDTDMDFAGWETILQDDVLDYMSDYVRLGQSSKAMQVRASKSHVAAYAETFVKLLGTLYPNLSESGHVYIDGVLCQAFHFGSGPLLSDDPAARSMLRNAVFGREGSHLRTNRVLRYYEDNRILIAKPDRLRYWLRSTAIRDADETLVDLVGQGY